MYIQRIRTGHHWYDRPKTLLISLFLMRKSFLIYAFVMYAPFTGTQLEHKTRATYVTIFLLL